MSRPVGARMAHHDIHSARGPRDCKGCMRGLRCAPPWNSASRCPAVVRWPARKRSSNSRRKPSHCASRRCSSPITSCFPRRWPARRIRTRRRGSCRAAPPFEARGAVTDEYLRLMRATWTTDPVTFEGRYYSMRGVHALPKPAQRRGIPIWIGGHTDAAVRRAATLGDAWHPIALRPPGLLFPDEYAKRAKELRGWAQQAGRDPKSIELTVRVPMEVRPRGAKSPGGDRPLFQGTAADVIADIRAYAAAGVTHFVFDPTVSELRAALTNMERFAQDIRGKLGHAVER